MGNIGDINAGYQFPSSIPETENEYLLNNANLTEDQCEQLISRINEYGEKCRKISRSLPFNLPERKVKALINIRRDYFNRKNYINKFTKKDSSHKKTLSFKEGDFTHSLNKGNFTQSEKEKLFLFFTNQKILSKDISTYENNVNIFINALDEYGKNWKKISDIFNDNGIFVAPETLSKLFNKVMKSSEAPLPGIFTRKPNIVQDTSDQIAANKNNSLEEDKYAFLEEELSNDSVIQQNLSNKGEELKREVETEAIMDELMAVIPPAVSPNSPLSPQSISSSHELPEKELSEQYIIIEPINEFTGMDPLSPQLSEEGPSEQYIIFEPINEFTGMDPLSPQSISSTHELPEEGPSEQDIIIQTINEFSVMDSLNISRKLNEKGIKKTNKQVLRFFENNRTKYFPGVKNELTRNDMGEYLTCSELETLNNFIPENNSLIGANFELIKHYLKEIGKKNWRKISDELHEKHNVDIASATLNRYMIKFFSKARPYQY